MGHVKNVMWIMADQLRWDYLSCYGHKTLHTPNLDGLANRHWANICARSACDLSLSGKPT